MIANSLFRATLYVCPDMHQDNYLIAPKVAYEQTAEGLREVEAYCSCGRVLQRVRPEEGLMLFSSAEIQAATVVSASLCEQLPLAE